ncbi:translation initiation factor IF-3 [Agrococcus sp. Marseille-Q4369]|uniref:translation initiation factor IF-3 n=1 Tax=Agrococcus sp. Marseille-Q4369 TaxID=2810513 RepID=UPI0032D5A967
MRLLVRRAPAHSSNEKEPAISDPRINERIRVPEVRLVGPAGEQVGVVRVEDALRLAREAELDLVEVAPAARPPVVKIMDYGKFKYEQAQKAKDARRNQANTVLKEVRFRLKIDEHDYETKRKRAQGFLEGGDKVKAMILFRGREQSRPEMGAKLLQRFAEDIREYGVVESSPTLDGRNMTMVVGPVRSKADAKTEQNAARSEQRKAAQEKRRLESERKAQRQAELEASRPAPRPAPARTPAPPSGEPMRVPRTDSDRSSRPDRSSRSSSDRPSSDRPSRPSSERSSESRSSESRSDSRPRQAPRTIAPTPANAPRPASMPKPAAAPGAAAPAAPAAPKPAATPAAPKPGAKPAAPSAVKPAAPKAKPAGKPADKPASE